MKTMKRSVFFILALLIFLSSIPIAQAETNTDSLSGIQIFPQDNIWNVPIDTLPVDPRSAEYINAMDGSAPVMIRWGGIPYNVVNRTQRKTMVSFRYAYSSDNVPYPIPDPDEVLIENSDSPVGCTAGSGNDCHVLIVDKDNKYLYELFGVDYWPGNGTWTAGSGAVWNLSSNQLRPSGTFSADAAGLAMLPGLLRYEEVNAGEINHALRFCADLSQNTYVWPARHGGVTSDTSYPPYGQRFRLKASFDTSGYPPYERTILNALKKYGMILSDIGAPWYITSSTDSSGTTDSRWSINAINRNLSVKGSDFEAVDVSSLMINADSGQARITQFVKQNSLHRNSSGNWYMDIANTGIVNKTFQFGKSGDIPVIEEGKGDWGYDAGAFRQVTEARYLDIFTRLIKRLILMFNNQYERIP